MNTLWGFIRRDLSIERKYRFNAALKTAAVLFQLAVFYFISRFLSPDYFPYVFIGIVFSQFFQFWLGVFSESIRQEQYMGTAEVLFCGPRGPLSILLFNGAGRTVLFVIELTLFVAAGICIFKVPLHWSWEIVGLLGVQTLLWAGLGLAAASVIMCFKRGDPVSWLVTVMVDLASGVYFPVALLPEPARAVAGILPTTVALDAWRLALGAGAGVPAVMWWYQLGWTAVSLAGAVFLFRRLYDRVRRNGDLGSY